MNEEQQVIAGATAEQPEPAPEVEETTPQPAAKARKKRAARKKAGKPRLQKFDVILLQLLKEGKSGAEEIREVFNVDEGEFRKRLETLLKRKLIVADESFSALHLSIQGVNGYKPEWKRQADRWLGRKEAKQKAEGKPLEEARPAEAQETKQERLEVEAEKKAVAEEVPAVERLDLEEVIRKYGPNEKQRQWKQKPSPFLERNTRAGRTQEKKAADKEPERDDAEEIPVKVVKRSGGQAGGESADKCELCKSGFVVSVKPEENNPKYGHCFCGAAYHKDCFEAVLEGDKKCVNCGRKLALTLDTKGEEAVSGIKDLSS